MEDSCPADCGRRCRLRRRHCMGPYEQGCQDNGDSYEYDSCDARRTTSAPDEDTNQEDEPDSYEDEDDEDGGPNGTPFQRFRGENSYRRAGIAVKRRVIKRRRKP